VVRRQQIVSDCLLLNFRGSVKILPFILCALLMMGATAVWAYQVIHVTEGGTIVGKVTVVGTKPTPKGFNLITFPDPVYCGRISTGTGWRILKEFTPAPDGGLQDAVVLLTDATTGKPFTRSNCRRLRQGTADFFRL